MTTLEIAQKSRYEVLHRLLLDEFVMVHLDPNHSGVVVPLQFLKQEMLTLKLSKLFRGRLDLTKEKVEAELLFDDDYFSCLIPLDAIWGATSHQGRTQVWKDKLPKSIVVPEQVDKPRKVAEVSTAPSAQTIATQGEQPTPVTKSVQKKRKGHLTRVK